jgi:hypothetical protein
VLSQPPSFICIILSEKRSFALLTLNRKKIDDYNLLEFDAVYLGERNGTGISLLPF